ncbi:MAG TPA: MEDS domain-containing protein [Candidatus Binatia bacterium]|nr:MEDS domain-containing protein [Candidatus Binatia bacterium]
MGNIELANATLKYSPHICAFFHSKEEEYRILLPFISEGFDRHQKAFHIVNPDNLEPHRERLASAGIDVAATQQTGQLEMRVWDQAYLRDGHFDQERMLALIEEVLTEGKNDGFSATRLVADMEWAREDRKGVEDLVVYETRLNHVLTKYDDPVCCTYDLSRFGADVVIDILRTHPLVILGGVLQENPFFVPPDQMLAELRERRAVA